MGSLQSLKSFATWLPRNGGLVSDLRLFHGKYLSKEWYEKQTCNMITEALQQCAVAAGIPGERAAAEAGAKDTSSGELSTLLQDPAPLPMRLHTFSTDYSVSPAALHVLACAGLQRLVLFKPYSPYGVNLSMDICTALACVTTLRQLQLPLLSFEVEASVVAAALDKLPLLTCLHLMHADGEIVRQLPVRLQHLALHPVERNYRGLIWQQVMSETAEEAQAHLRINITHLTALTALSVSNIHPELWHVAPPPQALSFTAQLTAGRIMVLSPYNMPCVVLGSVSACDVDLLNSLAEDPPTTSLHMELAPDCRQSTWTKIAAAVGQLTALTKLAFKCGGALSKSHRDVNPSPLFTQLPKLQLLQDLTLSTDAVHPVDLLHLTALLKLTSLSLTTPSLVGAEEFEPLANTLTALQCLQLDCGGWVDVAILAEVQPLRELRSLALRGAPSYQQLRHEISPALLLQLLPLTHLCLPLGRACPVWKRRAFLQQMPLLRCIDVYQEEVQKGPDLLDKWAARKKD